MNPWFSSDIAPFFSLLSLLATVSILERYAKQGRHRLAVMATYVSGLVLGGLLLAAGGVAVLVSQPRYVVGTLAFSGIVLVLVFAAAVKEIRRVYTDAELRRTVATDI